jgi:hypothetical protein
VFGFAPFGQVLQATLIIEYDIPAASQADVVDLANARHALRALPFPSEQYNAALQTVTERFTARNAAPGRPNGGALGQIRTNDFFQFSSAWEFREFQVTPSKSTCEGRRGAGRFRAPGRPFRRCRRSPSPAGRRTLLARKIVGVGR